MLTVLEQLQHGVNSKVEHPGNMATHTNNYFTEPAIDLPRIADSLASEIKSKHMAGPLKPQNHPGVKINGLMASPKPSGARRQVGNLSSPKGLSFNDGIPKNALKEWPVFQTTAKTFSKMIARAGWGSFMSKSDMVAAYKTLPVCIGQRRLQFFSFLGALFVDLRMVFGDRMACMFYDRLHYCIIHFMVRHRVPIPKLAVGCTVDDVPSVVPAKAVHLAKAFTDEYRKQLDLLNIGAAPNDPLLQKAFEQSQSGEVLGMWFNSRTMTWSLPAQKTTVLFNLLQKANEPGAQLSLSDVEALNGHLSNYQQLASPIALFAEEMIEFLKNLLEEYKSSPVTERSNIRALVPPDLKGDCKILAAIVMDSFTNPLPILIPDHTYPLDSIPIYTDASGDWTSNPSLGIYVPQHGHHQPLIASLRFPFYFLAKKDALGHAATQKTTVLESLGFLATLCLESERWRGKELLFHMDNSAASLALARGRSKRDRWATTIIRAARGVAAAIGASIHSKWTRRRSSRETDIADDLSHCRTSCLSSTELTAFLSGGSVRFPDPILVWMNNPKPDRTLGHACLDWIEKQQQ